ncbi:hypothetical protein [Chitinophaga oryziterrae]|uniref:hypothetical protein n=1 Tax=Chitinophaga oryziterrae TaxID=1031224 RepID=UPI0012F89507|nr:hypothetical protein [Chitinophaga oryziterrae]
MKRVKDTIERGLVNVIAIEFNEINVISRTLFRDVIDMMPGYDFCRLLPDGLLPLGAYKIKYRL